MDLLYMLTSLLPLRTLKTSTLFLKVGLKHELVWLKCFNVHKFPENTILKDVCKAMHDFEGQLMRLPHQQNLMVI